MKTQKKPRASQSLTATLAHAFLIVSAAALVISGGLHIFTNIQAQQEIIAGQQRLIAQDASKAVSGFFQEKFTLLETVGRLAKPDTVALAEQKQILGSLLGHQPAFRQLVLLNAQDQPVAQLSRLSQAASGRLTERFGSELLAQTKLGKNYISPVYIDPNTGEPLVVMASPATNALGDFQGALVAEVNLKFMWNLIDQLKVGETGTAFVVDKQGNLIAFNDIARVLRGGDVQSLDKVSAFINSSSSVDLAPAKLAAGIQGTTVVATYVPLGTPDWAVVTEMSVEEAYREVIRGAVTSIGITLAIAVLAGLIGISTARRLATPLIHLTETATAIARGEKSLQAAVDGPREITSLADAFNSMTTQLRQSLEDLEQRVVQVKRAEEELRFQKTLLELQGEASIDGILVVSPQGKMLSFNRRFVEMWEIPQSVVESKPDQAALESVLHKLADPQEFLDKVSYLYQHPDEQSRDEVILKDGRAFDRYTAPVKSADGTDYGRVWFFHDITERKQAEETLRQANLIVESSPVMLFRWKAAEGWPVMLVSQNVVQLGYTAEEFLTGSTNFASIVHPDDLERVGREVQSYSANGADRFQQEYRIVTKDRKVRWLDDRTVVERNAEGQVTHYQGIVVDITRRKLVEEALRESRNLLQTVLDTIPVRVFWKDRDLRYLGCNQPFAHDAGVHSPEEMLGKDDYQVGWREQADLDRSDDKQVLASGHPKFNYEEPQTTPEGRRIWVRTNKVPLHDADGTIRGVLGTYEDITERKQAENALRESEEKYRRLVEASPVAMWINKGGIITYMNPAALRILGATDLQQVVGRAALDFIHPDYHAIVKERISQTVDHELIAPLLEEKYVRLNGSVVDVEVTATPFTMAGGRAVQVLFQDITERKQAEEALQESEARYRALVESQIDLVSRYLPDTTLTFVNDAYCQFYGKTREELIGHSYLFMIAPEFRELVRKETENLAKDPRPLAGEYLNYRHDGTACWIQWVVQCIADENGRVVELQAVGRDITRLKQVEAEREELIADLEAKNAELERFTYTVSHDLKSPLVTMRGFLGFLEKDAVAGNLDQLRADIVRIRNATDKMQRLLNELLELSRIGRMMNPPQQVPFETIVREAIELVGGQIERRSVRVEIGPDLPMIYGDRARLVEVMQNLVDNACKFMGDQVEPRIEIGQRGTDDKGRPILFVRDNGIGIELQYHDKVFGLFNKLDAQSEGTGVGLALVKRIVEVHGGRIWIESAGAGKGTTFCFTLPPNESQQK